MSLNELAAQAWQGAEDAGWHKKPKSVYENLALIHSEVSEALETHRTDGTYTWVSNSGKPLGWGSELADIIIRVVELAQCTGVDLDREVERKMAYNAVRTDVPNKDNIKDI